MRRRFEPAIHKRHLLCSWCGFVRCYGGRSLLDFEKKINKMKRNRKYPVNGNILSAAYLNQEGPTPDGSTFDPYSASGIGSSSDTPFRFDLNPGGDNSGQPIGVYADNTASNPQDSFTKFEQNLGLYSAPATSTDTAIFQGECAANAQYNQDIQSGVCQSQAQFNWNQAINSLLGIAPKVVAAATGGKRGGAAGGGTPPTGGGTPPAGCGAKKDLLQGKTQTSKTNLMTVGIIGFAAILTAGIVMAIILKKKK